MQQLTIFSVLYIRVKQWPLCRSIAFLFFAVLTFSAQAQTQFIENLGQWPENVISRADVADGAVFLEETCITYQFWDKEKIAAWHNRTASDSILDFHNVKLHFEGCNPRPLVIKEKPFDTKYNYYKGNDPEKWASGALAYEKFTYYNVYEKIDLLIETTKFGFKYSFIVQPGGDPSLIKLRIEGADDIFLDQGRLKILTSLSPIIEEAPYSFQRGDKEIPTTYDLQGNLLKFSVSEYNKFIPLTIDPSVIFSSLSLSVSDNWGFTATYDEEGNGYTGGTVYASDYITTVGAYQRNFEGGAATDAQARDCGIYKLSSDGRRLIYATFYGGNRNEQPHSLVVNSKNELVVYGTTTSNDLPTVKSVQKAHQGRHDIFLAKFNALGTSLLASTYLGSDGEDGLNGEYTNYAGGQYRNTSELVYNYGDVYRGEVLVDSFDNIYVASTTSSSNGFPTTSGVLASQYQGGEQDAIVVKLSPDMDTLIWSTFLGGNNHDAAYSLDFDKDGNVYVTGGTKSSNFPKAGNPFDDSYNGGMCDAFVAYISADGSKLLATTFMGTSGYDQGFFIKVGPDNLPYVLGQTQGSNFPVKNTSNNANLGIFITKFKKDLSDINLSKRFGENNIVNISPSAFSVDQCGRVYFSGWGGLIANDNATGNTDDLVTTRDAEKRISDGRDFYIAVYTQDLATPIYATFWGGNDADVASSEHVDGGTSRFDKRGVVYQAICAACNGGETAPSARFPTYPANVYGPRDKHVASTNCNNALVKIDLEGPALFTEFERTEITCKVPQEVTFTNFTQNATTFDWDMGDGTNYSDSNVTHTYKTPGEYIVTLIAYNPIACNLRDTQRMKLTVYAKSEADFEADIDVCTGEVTFNRTGNYGRNFDWDLGDNTTSSRSNPTNTYAEGKYTIKLLTDGNTDCADTFSLDIEIVEPFTDFEIVLDTCAKTISTTNSSKGFEALVWDFDDGDTAKSYEPEHIYADRGEYELKLTTNPGLSCEETLNETITIPDPASDFEFIIDTCATTVEVTNNSVDAPGFTWRTSDGQKLKDAEPVIKFPEGDRYYDIELIAAPFSKCADTSIQNFRMPGLPIALFESKADTCVSAIQFTNKSKDAPSYHWDFGNGETSKVKHPFVNFRDTGTFKISLIAYPFSDCPDTLTQLVDVDTFRFALFDLELDTCEFIIQLNNKSEDLDSFRWEFGDGGGTTAKDPEHTYGSHGEYEILLFGEKEINGCKDTFSYMLQLPELPVAGYEYETDSCLNTWIFKDTSNFGIQAIWKSSTGDSAIGPVFRVEFPRADDYDVTLVSRSEYSCFDTLLIPVTIDSIPTARFGFKIDSCKGALDFNNRSFGGFRSVWDFGNNTGSRDLSPEVTYDEEGYKRVLLIINEGTECEDSIEKEILITQYLTERVEFTNFFSPNGDGYNDVWKVRQLRKDCDYYHLYIYNRWGNLVTEIEGESDFEWDGTNLEASIMPDNTPMAAGVYYYVFMSETLHLSGTITLVR